MIPVLNKEPLYQLKIPEMSGGLNLRDGISLVNDNQLTDVKNMWYKDGILRTRPSIKEKGYTYHSNESYLKHAYDPNKTTIDGKEYSLSVDVSSRGIGGDNILNVRFIGKDNDIEIPELDVGYVIEDVLPITHIENVLPITHNGNVYLYVYGQNENVRVNRIYISERKSDGTYDEFRTPRDGEIYSPLVLTNVWSSYQQGGDVQALLRNGATQAEGFNLLGNRYRMQGSLYDASELGEVHVMNSEGTEVIDTVSYMEYSVPFTPNNLSYEGVIRLRYTDIQGKVHTHAVYCPNINDTDEPSRVEDEKTHQDAKDGYYLHSFVCGDIVHICLNKSPNAGENNPATISRAEYVNNNMMIYAPCETSSENWEKVTAMARATWYGNASLGVNGGSRLFLGGNIKDDEKALVVWSDFENPLYFSENNYAYVGDKSQKVTAFGRQGSSLIVFKENEIYSTQYIQNEVTAEDIINQTTIDITANMAYFPMVLIHSTIGCDCPDTIQLCRNRLVFANSSGRVFTLTGQNQYSERNVYEVSEMISDRLKNETNLKNACSADWDGKYIIFVGTNAYLMDYNSYGYENIASYTRQGDANMLLPWWVWEFPVEIKNAVLLNSTIVLTNIKIYGVGEDTESYTEHKYYIDGTYGNDKLYDTHVENEVVNRTEYEQIIPTLLQTKIFDFNEQARYKTISSVDIAFGNNKNAPISVKFINGVNDTDEHIVTVNGAETTLKTPSHITNKRLIPYTRICGKFGILIQCLGQLEIDGINIKYKQAGGIK